MLPMVVAAMEAVFYLLCVPVNLALIVSDRAGARVGAGVSAFVRHRARRRALEDLAPKPGHKKTGPEPGRVWAVLRRLRFERVAIAGTVGLGDAAATALFCGALSASACALRSRADHFRADIRPDFSNDLHIELRGMLTARAGQIIMAAIFKRKGV